jgi:hypothetical protein
MKQPQEVLRELLRVAHEVRSRHLDTSCRMQLRDSYALCYYMARELSGRYPDLLIMVGDREDEHGLVQHMWLEIPSGEIYVDPAYDALDPFQPVRLGRTSDAEFASTYRNGQDANCDVEDPRNRPELLFKTKSAWDSER